jgi:signal transduction histidine kinase
VRLVDELRRELTTLIQELRPVVLQGKGLVPAVSDYAAGWSRQNGITPEIRVQGERILSLETEQTLFRIIQEALANVARHSQATHVEILLTYNTSVVRLTIDDNGQGFEADGKDRGLGLRSMQERAESLGGKLIIESRPGQGTRLTCSVPVDSSKEADTGKFHG